MSRTAAQRGTPTMPPRARFVGRLNTGAGQWQQQGQLFPRPGLLAGLQRPVAPSSLGMVRDVPLGILLAALL